MEDYNQKKPQKYNFRYTPVPFRLLRAYDLLDKNDRDLLIQIMSWGEKSGCFVSVDNLTEVIMKCGEHAFYRSLYKLKLLGLVRYRRGGYHRSNQYWAEFDVTRWRLTRDLMLLIKDDLKGLGIQDPVFRHEPFPNTYGFYKVFNSIYPDYAVQFKEKEIQSLPDLLSEVPQADGISIWVKRLSKLQSGTLSLEKKILDYFYHIAEIEAVLRGDDQSSIEQEEYLRLLENEFNNIERSSINPEQEAMLRLGKRLVSDGKTSLEIDQALRNLLKSSS